MAIQFLNSMYRSPRRMYDATAHKYVTMSNDVLIYTTKNTETLESELHIQERPGINFYLSTKPQPFHKVSIPLSEARKVHVAYVDRDKEIAQSLNCLDEYYNSAKNGSGYDFKKRLMKNPNLYLADMNIEDYYKTCFIMKEGEAIANKFSMSFSDIEVDISTLEDDFPEPSVAPSKINLITTIYADTMDLYTFMLYDERVKDDIAWIVNNPDEYVKQYVDKDMREAGFKFHINAYRTEMDLIRAFFDVVHTHNPDFMAWWNMPFDMPTILNRMRRNGLNDEQIADIVCDPRIPKKFRYFKYIEDPKRKLYNAQDDDEEEEEEDVSSKNSKQKPHPSRLVDWVEIPGITQHYDQLSMFSNLRKRTLYRSYKLDVIGEEFAGQKKLNLEDAGYNIKTVNIENFKLFVAYNQRDVFVQYCIEKAQRDMYQYVVFSDNTRLSKGHQQSIIIKNKLMLYLLRAGEIMGNAIDYDVHSPIPGALVGRPELIEQGGIPIGGQPSYLFENAIDLDFSSLYPSVIILFNIFKSSLFGHVTDIRIPDPTKPDGFISMGDGEGLFEMLQCIDQSIFTVCKEYFGLPSPEEVLASITGCAEKEALKRAGKVA